MKRYKQVILSNFFVVHIQTPGGLIQNHLVESNLDIESRADRTLCTEVLHGAYRYEVLTNGLLTDVCPICSAILARRISNMPKERKHSSTHQELVEGCVPESQMNFLFGEAKRAKVREEEAKQQQFEF